MYRLVVATGNAHKFDEIRAIIGDIGVDWIPGTDIPAGPVEETGETYESNALIKAAVYARESGLPALADDSGLEVDALNGLPGVRSNRSFGPGLTDAEKIAKLLKLLAGVPDSERTARFVCHAVIVEDGNPVCSVRGAVEGVIIHEPRGSDGFGYDPVFLVPGLGRTFAEIPENEKSAVSHRGRAMRRVRDFLLQRVNQSW